ncbi:hypothetical protein [Streptomyces sp. NPDC059455]|uniref:hypothetical protein n=1 Tax=Streptomyces sp. NPDC059455 TaxID=3346837 RepID=UPI003673CA47
MTGPSAVAIAVSTRRGGASRSHSSTLYGSLVVSASTIGTTAGRSAPVLSLSRSRSRRRHAQRVHNPWWYSRSKVPHSLQCRSDSGCTSKHDRHSGPSGARPCTGLICPHCAQVSLRWLQLPHTPPPSAVRVCTSRTVPHRTQVSGSRI